ncbi:hypothetical protein NE237_012577 [Protea cynaroides]|uniref:Uncharacterized protein n=1 Tax=Protea cynaroides TaxID=273540 RepID=A0A9Q0H256_9MAGN|nr:hypothetical protein NE237_012577 [Protea cynaroides]
MNVHPTHNVFDSALRGTKKVMAAVRVCSWGWWWWCLFFAIFITSSARNMNINNHFSVARHGEIRKLVMIEGRVLSSKVSLDDYHPPAASDAHDYSKNKGGSGGH